MSMLGEVICKGVFRCSNGHLFTVTYSSLFGVTGVDDDGRDLVLSK